MIRINLLPLRDAERAVGRRNQVSLVALGATISALIMIVPYMIQGRQIGQIEADIVETQDQIAIYNKKVAEVHELEKVRADVEAKLQVVQDLNDQRVGPARMLHDLSVATPENLWLLDFNEGNANATLTGMALDNETIARFMRQLSASDYFVAVDLVETSRRAPTGPANAAMPLSFTRFIVKATIDYFGRDGEKPAVVPPAEVEAKAVGGEKNS
jgi:type IV pilus assembly protein PilN